MAEKLESGGVRGRKTPPALTKGAGGAAGGAAVERERRRALKKPAELVAYYTAKGMDEKAAHEKVIEDLQKALAVSFQSYPMQKMMLMDKQLKSNMDLFTQRLTVIERKVILRLDSNLWLFQRHCVKLSLGLGFGVLLIVS
jgi:hypothetical protein